MCVCVCRWTRDKAHPEIRREGPSDWRELTHSLGLGSASAERSTFPPFADKKEEESRLRVTLLLIPWIDFAITCRENVHLVPRSFGFPVAVVESSQVGRRRFENRIVDLSRGFDLASPRLAARRDEGQTPTKGPRSTSVLVRRSSTSLALFVRAFDRRSDFYYRCTRGFSTCFPLSSSSFYYFNYLTILLLLFCYLIWGRVVCQRPLIDRSIHGWSLYYFSNHVDVLIVYREFQFAICCQEILICSEVVALIFNFLLIWLYLEHSRMTYLAWDWILLRMWMWQFSDSRFCCDIFRLVLLWFLPWEICRRNC